MVSTAKNQRQHVDPVAKSSGAKSAEPFVFETAPSVLQVLQRKGCLACNATCHVDFLIRDDFSGQSNDLSLGGPFSGSVASLEIVKPRELGAGRLQGSRGFVPRWLALN